MNDVKEIRLLSDQMHEDAFPCYVMKELNAGNTVTLIPPPRRIIKLADLPSDLVVEFCCTNMVYFKAYASAGRLHRKKGANGCYISAVNGSSIHNIRIPEQKGWTPWVEGGECPVPEGVNVEVIDRAGGKGEGHGVSYSWVHVSWDYARSATDIIFYRITGEADGCTVEV